MLLDYISETHRLDLHRQAEMRRLARLARDERLPDFRYSLQNLWGRLVARFESGATSESHPVTSAQEMQPCADAG